MLSTVNVAIVNGSKTISYFLPVPIHEGRNFLLHSIITTPPFHLFTWILTSGIKPPNQFLP